MDFGFATPATATPAALPTAFETAVLASWFHASREASHHCRKFQQHSTVTAFVVPATIERVSIGASTLSAYGSFIHYHLPASRRTEKVGAGLRPLLQISPAFSMNYSRSRRATTQNICSEGAV